MRAPAVIIGVGGIGSDICARIERMLPQDAPDRGVFRFVIMDTDVNTIRDIKRNGFGGTTIRLSDNMTVNACLEMLKKGTLADWYPENGIFANKAMTEGAGQYRSVSRLAFEYAVHETKLDELERIIKERFISTDSILRTESRRFSVVRDFSYCQVHCGSWAAHVWSKKALMPTHMLR